jgi:hypothetical protein
MLTPGSLLEPLVELYHNAEIVRITDDFVISKDISTRRKKSMPITVVLAFLAGLNTGNGIPHFITGITGQEHPSPLGKSAVVNLLEGWGAFLIGGIFWYFTCLQHGDLVLVYAFAALGVFAINLFHAYVWRANPEFYKHILPGQK